MQYILIILFLVFWFGGAWLLSRYKNEKQKFRK